MSERTKGELKMVNTFDKLYLHIKAHRIADIPRTGSIDDIERILNAEHLLKCWNSHDDLLRSDEERESYAITIRKIWAALGIMDYKAADGKSIDELVLLIKQQRDDLLADCEEVVATFVGLQPGSIGWQVVTKIAQAIAKVNL